VPTGPHKWCANPTRELCQTPWTSSKYGDLALQVGGVSRIGTIEYGLESRGTSTRDCAAEDQQKQQIADPSSRQRGRYKITYPQLSKENFKAKQNWSRVPDGCLTPRRTGRLTIGRNITLILTLTCWVGLWITETVSQLGNHWGLAVSCYCQKLVMRSGT
jgi:hypothetical protein